MRWNFGMVAKIAQAFAALEKGMPGHQLDFRARGQSVPVPTFTPPKPKLERKVNLRLHLGPSDSGRLMRNRTPAPTPVRLTCHDWWRRENIGTSKRIASMTEAEKRAAMVRIEEAKRRG